MTENETPKAARPEEQDLYASNPTMFRNHPIAFILCALLVVAGIIGGPVSLFMVEDYGQGIAIGSGVVALVAGLVMLRWWLRTLATKLRVTSQRTILRRGLLSKHINEISHNNIRNVQVEQSPLQRIFSTGTVKIASAGQATVEIEVEGLPHPQKIRELINEHRNG